jgi:hypothetical protein
LTTLRASRLIRCQSPQVLGVRELLGVAFLCSFPVTAYANDVPTSPKERVGWQGGIRIGYAQPMGAIRSLRGFDLSEVFREQIPITFDLGYKPQPRMYLGAFASLLPGTGGSRFEDLCAARGCLVMGTRFGGLLIGHFRPSSWVNPWLGIGVGGDISSITAENARGRATLTLRGFDIAHFVGGLDVRISRYWGIGPFVDMTFGMYTHSRVSTVLQTTDEPIDEKWPHAWLYLGVRCVVFP